MRSIASRSRATRRARTPPGSSGPCSRVRSPPPWVRTRCSSLKVALDRAGPGLARINDDVEFHRRGREREDPEVLERRQQGRGHHPGRPRPRRPPVPRGEAGHHGRRGRAAAASSSGSSSDSSGRWSTGPPASWRRGEEIEVTGRRAGLKQTVRLGRRDARGERHARPGRGAPPGDPRLGHDAQSSAGPQRTVWQAEQRRDSVS